MDEKLEILKAEFIGLIEKTDNYKGNKNSKEYLDLAVRGYDVYHEIRKLEKVDEPSETRSNLFPLKTAELKNEKKEEKTDKKKPVNLNRIQQLYYELHSLIDSDEFFHNYGEIENKADETFNNTKAFKLINQMRIVKRYSKKIIKILNKHTEYLDYAEFHVNNKASMQK